MVTPSQPTLVLDRVLRVLRPLVGLLVRNGVTYTVLAAALKRVFLDAARRELENRQMPQTDSAMSLLSGVHRRDVRELTRGPVTAAAPATPGPLGMAAQVVARWMHDPSFQTEDGHTRVLPRAGEGASFDTLVAGVSRDVRPRAVLDELLRLGVVQETAAGITLEGSGFAPRAGFEEVSWLTAANLHDHAGRCGGQSAGRSQLPGAGRLRGPDQRRVGPAAAAHGQGRLEAGLPPGDAAGAGTLRRRRTAARSRARHTAHALACTSTASVRTDAMNSPVKCPSRLQSAPGLVLALLLAGLLAACGPGVGGSGTGATEDPLRQFGATALPACGNPLAPQLASCVKGQPLSYADSSTLPRVTVQLLDSHLELQAPCAGLNFSGDWGGGGRPAASLLWHGDQ
ncbi:MAG: DUF6502 family protein [Burkholderiaceae bacterium]